MLRPAKLTCTASKLVADLIIHPMARARGHKVGQNDGDVKYKAKLTALAPAECLNTPHFDDLPAFKQCHVSIMA